MKKTPFSLFSFHYPANIRKLILASDEKFKTIYDLCSEKLIEQSVGDIDYISELVTKNADDVLVLYAEDFDESRATYAEIPIMETSTGKTRFWFFFNSEIPSFVMLLYILYKRFDPNDLKVRSSKRPPRHAKHR